MTEADAGHRLPDWDPRAPEVLADQVHAYDALRSRCPVAHSDYLGWSLLRHDDVAAAAADHATFSSRVSAHLSVPSGMDPPEHTPHRQINERYFTADRMSSLEPELRRIAATLVDELPRGVPVEVMEELGEPYALQAQSAFMGWSDADGTLSGWARRNHAATLSGDRTATAAVAREFDDHIRGVLARRRVGPTADVTSELLRETVGGRPLTDDEIVSVVRNWTAGELGTIAASVGILAHALGTRPEVQAHLRARPGDIGPATDELLRITPPLVANRRVTTCPVQVGGRDLAAGERVTLLWASANRDEAVFGDPDEFRLDRDPAANLLYGTGIHACPGAPLARLELRVLVEELLGRTRTLAPAAAAAAVPAHYPAGGFATVTMVLG